MQVIGVETELARGFCVVSVGLLKSGDNELLLGLAECVVKRSGGGAHRLGLLENRFVQILGQDQIGV